MTILKSVQVNCETGEVIETPYTEEEMIQVLADQELAAQRAVERQAQEEAEAQAKAEAKASAEAKLSALGLTPEEIAALR